MKIYLIATLIFVLAMPQIVFSAAQPSTDASPHKYPKITFIELGSLNCIPCKMMQPIMKEIEEKYKELVKVVFYDIRSSEGRPYAEKYKIRMIPTQVFLDKDGKEYYRHVGFFTKDEIEKILKLKNISTGTKVL